MARKAAAERRRDLIEAGLRVIAREGIHGATVRAIVAEAGVPLATFHYVFHSRDEMIGEAYAYVVLPDPDAQEPRLPANATLVEVIRALMEEWIEQLVARPEYELAIMEIMAYCRRSPELEHLPGTVQRRYVEAVSGLLAMVCERTGVESARPLEELATLVLHVSDGVTYHLLRTGDADAARRYIDDAAPMLAAAIGHGATVSLAAQPGADDGAD
ncbi:TetR family transcriptional regulator [Agrococcus sp. ProA11]|uniref:TetR/AcrR family transcriptional regulator n=1 Tax=Agrococcus chionoecetis TaxID=3153752 RepID=UPI003260509A